LLYAKAVNNSYATKQEIAIGRINQSEIACNIWFKTNS